MDLTNIVKGHILEIFDAKKEMSDKRMRFCRKCRIFKSSMGGICNGHLCVNPITNDSYVVPDKERFPLELHKPKDGYFRGCYCRLEAKTRLTNEQCPAGKW